MHKTPVFKTVSLAGLLMAGLALLSSCQKDTVDEPAPIPTNEGPSNESKIKDSILLLTREIYLWYNQIPATFNAQSFSTPDQTMKAIRTYSIETGFTAPVDRWSYAMTKAEWNNSSMGLVQQTAETGADLGMNVFFRAEGDLRVRHVEPGSAAGRAGVRRGWRITRINGNSNVTTTNANLVIDAVYESANSSFTFQKPDGTSIDLVLTANAYVQHPVVLDSVYAAGSRKAGYLVFNSFMGDTAQIYNDLDRAFGRFSREGVNELIIDLRYNGGGYVTVQERLANYLVNAAYNGQVMMSEKFNDRNAGFNYTTRFRKLGSVNVGRIFFIVSNNTASASELLINNLRPYMDVKLVGPSATHGKPVGFFPIAVGEWYIFPVSFRTVNRDGQGDYFGGLQLTNRTSDGIDRDWGDRNETSLSTILTGFSTGFFRTTNSEVAPNPFVEGINSRLAPRGFKGTIDTRGIR